MLLAFHRGGQDRFCLIHEAFDGDVGFGGNGTCSRRKACLLTTSSLLAATSDLL